MYTCDLSCIRSCYGCELFLGGGCCIWCVCVCACVCVCVCVRACVLVNIVYQTNQRQLL